MKPEVAFYYPGQYWINADWIKNLILFFDGIAMLIPKYMEDHGTFDDYPIISSLKDHGLFQVIRPEENVDAEETKALAEAFAEIIDTGRLDHLTKASDKDVERSNFGSLSMSRLGYFGDKKLADSIFQELKARGLADDSEDGVSIPMHRIVRALILVLLAQILRPRGEEMGLTLSPVTDKRMLVDALNEIFLNPDASSPSVGDIVSFDMAMVGVDLGSVPIEEILDFRQQNYSQHRDYSLLVRKIRARIEPHATGRTSSCIRTAPGKTRRRCGCVKEVKSDGLEKTDIFWNQPRGARPGHITVGTQLVQQSQVLARYSECYLINRMRLASTHILFQHNEHSIKRTRIKIFHVANLSS